jgi:hypothetical protein
MSDTDSFIEEVTEEVRRDRLFLLMRRYGWIAVAVIVLIVGGAGVREYLKAQQQAAAEALGDGLVAALAENDSSARAVALSEVPADNAGAIAVQGFLAAGAMADAGETDNAVAELDKIIRQTELPVIYRNIATFKSILLQKDTLPSQDIRLQLESLSGPGAPLRLLAEEQLGLLDISEGQTQAAIDRFQLILTDSEATSDLQQRASQVIVALGGTPEPVGYGG